MAKAVTTVRAGALSPRLILCEGAEAVASLAALDSSVARDDERTVIGETKKTAADVVPSDQARLRPN